MEWIAFADRRPDNRATVLAYSPRLPNPVTATFWADADDAPNYEPGLYDPDAVFSEADYADAYEWTDAQGDGYGFPGMFTHWMPLPAPPIPAPAAP